MGMVPNWDVNHHRTHGNAEMGSTRKADLDPPNNGSLINGVPHVSWAEVA